jgi:hypothetical protein
MLTGIRMTRVLTPLVLGVGYGLELLILTAVYDPQGDWRLSSHADITFYGPWSALPYIAVVAWFLLTLKDHRHVALTLRCALAVAGLGVVIAFVALRQGAHTAAGLLPLGFMCQWLALGVCLVVAWRRRAPE